MAEVITNDYEAEQANGGREKNEAPNMATGFLNENAGG